MDFPQEQHLQQHIELIEQETFQNDQKPLDNINQSNPKADQQINLQINYNPNEIHDQNQNKSPSKDQNDSSNQQQQSISQQQEAQPYKDNVAQSNKISRGKRTFMHVKLLLEKNSKIAQRHWRNTAFLLSTPLVVTLLILFWQFMADRLIEFQIIEGELSQNPLLPKCIPPERSNNGEDCLTVGYTIIGPREAWTEYVMDFVAKTNNLQFGQDIQMISQGSSPEALYTHLKQQANKTQIAVIFCTSEWPIGKNYFSIPCKFEELGKEKKKLIFYTIVYNWTLTYQSPYLQDLQAAYSKDQIALRLQISIDNALIQLFGRNSSIVKSNIVDAASKILDDSYTSEQRAQVVEDLKIMHLREDSQGINDNSGKSDDLYKERMHIVEQEYPKIPTRFENSFSVSASAGAFYFFIPIMINFIMVINEILREKEKRLRQGLTIMGLGHTPYWLSWIVTSCIYTSGIVLCQIASGFVFRLDIFVKTPFLVQFMFFFTFGMCVQVIGYFVTTVVSDAKNGYTFAYAFMLIAIVMQMFLTSPQFIYYLFIDDHPYFVKLMVKIFQFYPAFHYSKIYGDICKQSCVHYSPEDARWIAGSGYEYSHLTMEQTGKFFVPKLNIYHAPSTLQSYLAMIATFFFFMLLTWYCDHVIPGNRGTTDSALFFLSRDYWQGCFCKRKKDSQRKKSSGVIIMQEGQSASASSQCESNPQITLEDTANLEKSRVIKNEQDQLPVFGLRVMNLSKIYRRLPFGLKSKNDITALREVFLEVEQGELLAILGHNGAGKSTLINILTGILTANEGTAHICGLSIHHEMDDIRSIMGVCPQFDVLWDELTAYEHLRMYSMIKEIPEDQIDKEINSRLEEVGLLVYKHATIGTYSGGMKRRTSLAISAIGNPRVIFLDEPTTGMDPKTKRNVWEMIRKLKIGRSLILTTHGMDEADALSDRIAVLAEGQVKCLGTSLFLKNKSGCGYRVTLLVDQQNIEIARQMIKELIPSCQIVDYSGGSIVATIPVMNLKEISAFFKIIEMKINDERAIKFREIVKDWGLSHVTLEEVFMKITKNSQNRF